jgi:hypothetical protein
MKLVNKQKLKIAFGIASLYFQYHVHIRVLKIKGSRERKRDIAWREKKVQKLKFIFHPLNENS